MAVDTRAEICVRRGVAVAYCDSAVSYGGITGEMNGHLDPEVLYDARRGFYRQWEAPDVIK